MNELFEKSRDLRKQKGNWIDFIFQDWGLILGFDRLSF